MLSKLTTHPNLMVENMTATQRQRVFQIAMSAAVLLLVAMLAFIIIKSTENSQPSAANNTPFTISLSDQDTALYRRIVDLQREKRWNEADTAINKLDDEVLLGKLLAERYLSAGYSATESEISAWMADYSQLTDATAMSARYKSEFSTLFTNILPAANAWEAGNNIWKDGPGEHMRQAIPKKRAASYRFKNFVHPKDKREWISIRTQFSRGNYTLALAKAKQLIAHSGERTLSGYWLAGLSAWRLKLPAEAAHYFAALATDPLMSTPKNIEEKATAAFWAYRAYRASGYKAHAANYLSMASQTPQTLYGFMAASIIAKQGGTATNAEAKHAVLLADPTLGKKYAHIQAFAALDYKQETFKQLNQELAMAPAADKPYIFALSKYLKQPLSNVLMANHWVQKAHQHNHGYPVPKWASKLQPKTDKALVLAIVHQESNFNAKAGSYKGAQGLMQIMPTTADFLIEKHGALEYKTASNSPYYGDSAAGSRDLRNANINLRIGQAYIRHLSGIKYIKHNLPVLAAAYNAGPGTVRNWTRKGIVGDDPLLFIETIPFAETRGYVKNVLRNYVVYDFILNDSIKSANSLANGVWPTIRY